MRNSLLFLLLSLSFTANASICQSWSPSEKMGLLNTDTINEASGLAISRVHENRIYHINDSGDGANFYITEENGSNTRTVSIENFSPRDVEDLAYGNCHHRQTCLYIGDIGDNAEERATIQIAVVEELEKFNKSATPISIITAKYPDRPHNAEGMAVHPNGDIFILTKEADFVNRRALSAQIFKISRDSLESKRAVKEMEYVGELDLPYMLYFFGLNGRIATAFDIAPNGEKFALLTYQGVVEIDIDLAGENVGNTRSWKFGAQYSVAETVSLPQQEALAYYPDGKTLLYTTEYQEWAEEAGIYKLQCE